MMRVFGCVRCLRHRIALVPRRASFWWIRIAVEKGWIDLDSLRGSDQSRRALRALAKEAMRGWWRSVKRH